MEELQDTIDKQRVELERLRRKVEKSDMDMYYAIEDRRQAQDNLLYTNLTWAICLTLTLLIR